MEATLQSIFKAGFKHYREQHGLSMDQYQAAKGAWGLALHLTFQRKKQQQRKKGQAKKGTGLTILHYTGNRDRSFFVFTAPAAARITAYKE
jgi:hypothetical protein